MISTKKTTKGRDWPIAWFLFWGISLSTACDRAPREPESVSSETSTKLDYKTAPATPTAASGGADSNFVKTCVQKLIDPPAPVAHSLTDCPKDPDSRPTMPTGTISFPDSDAAPEIRVELALSTAHRTHGLMYRPELKDSEGMLFSWTNEKPRSFWMRNTCLALDMLFVAQDGTIAGILEQVPPMNEQPRRIPCPATHVLEVRAGWTREYGVKPGQKLLINPSSERSSL